MWHSLWCAFQPLWQITFGVEKVGEALGRTKKEAKYNAAESSLRFLASRSLHPRDAFKFLFHVQYDLMCIGSVSS